MDFSILEHAQAFLQGLNSIKHYLLLTVLSIVVIIGSVYGAEMCMEGRMSSHFLLIVPGIVVIVGLIYALKVLVKHQMPSKPRYRLLHRVH